MPSKLQKFCEYPGCSEIVSTRFCAEHAAAHESTKQQRESSTSRGYDSKWRNERLVYLKTYPLCARCAKKGIVEPATVVDHIIPHRGNKKLFWDKKNWQPLCKKCHDIKTSTEDGAFGRESSQG